MALFGIKRIQYCKATQLAFSGQNNPFLGIASEPTNTFTDIVCLVNSRATLTIEQTVQNKQIVYTAKLQFVTPADPALDVDHYAFIATTNDGERILLGANTRPQVAVVTAQGIYGTSGELTAYTTTAEFKANYRPLRLPVTAAEPISGPAYDICCGQIPQPTAPDTREFDICCGQIIGQEPTPPPPPTETVVAVVTGLDNIRYEKSYDGKRLYYLTSSFELMLETADLQNIVVLRISNKEEGSYHGSQITAVQWNEQYLPSSKTWIVDNNIRLGYYTGNNQTGDWYLIYWYYDDEGGNYEDWCFYVSKAIYPPATPPTRQGYTFKGWATTSGGQPVSNFGNMPAEDIAFYAVWEAI